MEKLNRMKIANWKNSWQNCIGQLAKSKIGSKRQKQEIWLEVKSGEPQRLFVVQLERGIGNGNIRNIFQVK